MKKQMRIKGWRRWGWRRKFKGSQSLLCWWHNRRDNGKTITVKTEYDIWKALQGNGILTEGCQLLSFKVNEETHLIDLDFNAATGEYIRSMGTTGEIQIIGCIINTYLETYDCDGIKLTEEGKVLQTSHGANYDGYSGIMSFWNWD